MKGVTLRDRSRRRGLGAAVVESQRAWSECHRACRLQATQRRRRAHIWRVEAWRRSFLCPADAPETFKRECRALGAKVFLVDGLINDAGAIVNAHAKDRGWFDVSTLKEPYRAEGKKTMGYEIVEQLGWRVPDAIIYPTGGGTGIVGMWKAFDELEKMGFIGSDRPKMIVVQATGCAPIVKAFESGERHAPLWENADTIAPGMRVPVAIGDYLILDAVRASGGTAIAVTDEALLAGTDQISSLEGMHMSPEVGACVAATAQLRESGFLSESDETIIFGTGSGLKHVELVGGDYPVLTPGSANLGEIIDTWYAPAT